MIGLEALELVEQRVELLVRDFRGVADVIALLVMPDGVAELSQAFFRIR